MNEFQLSWRPPRTSSSSLTEIVPDSFITIVRPQKLQAPELNLRNVDGHHLGGLTRIGPGSGLCARFTQDPGAKRQNQATFLCDGNELRGRYKSSFWMLPARQRLRSYNRSRFQTDSQACKRLTHAELKGKELKKQAD
jgi:hypothetical protein